MEENLFLQCLTDIDILYFEKQFNSLVYKIITTAVL